MSEHRKADRKRMEKLSYKMENYLEAVYELTKEDHGARISDIAEKLNVSKASTNSAMATLSEKGLIINEKYKEVFLTQEGLELAKITANKHHVIQQFLSNVLKVDFTIADEDACAIEHVISNVSVNAMQKYLQSKNES